LIKGYLKSVTEKNNLTMDRCDELAQGRV